VASCPPAGSSGPSSPSPALVDVMTAADARVRLDGLVAEHRAAITAGLEGNTAYMADLETDLAASNALYVGLAVTEIATLRGLLGDRNEG
jgi:hypothetical protein